MSERSKRGSVAVLDASAVLALLKRERGARLVASIVRRKAAMSTVNLAEVLSKHSESGRDPEVEYQKLLAWRMELHPFTTEDAVEVAQLIDATHAHGLSMGDRACLALARRLSLPAITSDAAWAQIDVGVDIRLIR